MAETELDEDTRVRAREAVRALLVKRGLARWEPMDLHVLSAEIVQTVLIDTLGFTYKP